MKIAIIANGEISNHAVTRQKLADADYLIACDGGLRHFPLLGIMPHCLIGDFDSAPRALREKYTAQGIPLVRFPAEKDETDLALAVAHALTLSPTYIYIVAALGGRFDHALANVHVLAQAGEIPAEIWDETTSIQLIRKQRILPCENYRTLTLLPLTSEVTGIITKGLRYPLNNETLHAGEVRGVSNEFSAEEAEISIKSGMLLAIRCM
ncbi:MAG: thiamine diphosphokinase [Defluviitaleaceae bacterium]|nr:thiamine diphosphokinase [Defluviitaleaceae bacterium]MCL2275287.1 thiamine diphosphokinase [Defluviitaleaceae bacterium]